MANGEVAIALEKMEEKAEAIPVADNSKEKVASSHSKPEATVENSVMKDEHGSSKKWSPKEEEAHDPPQGCFLQKWKKIFVASCLFAVLLDPLFLYVPMMRDEIKCLLYDRNLKIAALLLRSVTDLFYILDIIFQIYASPNYSDVMDLYRRIRLYCSKIRFWRKYFVPTIAKTILGSYNILIDIMAILPLPQVAILIFFSEMSDLRSLTAIRMVIMNLFVSLQYVPRALRIYLSCKELKRAPKKETGETAIWVKGVLNFFMYILSSHVLGAICYFFAIQRMATCWSNACRKANGCNTSTFGCRYHHTDRNITFLNDLCPISPVNTSLFDFGIYITVLQSGIMGSTNYFQKFSNCFWWGLRNLSSLGSNLEPSVDGWENLFAAFISIIGLLLFLYLIGNLQTYMQFDTARIEAHRHNMKVEQKMEEKAPEIESWFSKNGIPKKLHDLKLNIMNKVRQELEENRDADLHYILSNLPVDLRSHIESCMPMARLKKVLTLKKMDERMLRRICQCLEPREFDDYSIIIEKGKPLEIMLFIVEGNVSIEKRNGSSPSSNNLQQLPRGAGEVCGEELLRWPLSTLYPRGALLLATESAKAIGHVEALVLKAIDLRGVVDTDYFVGMMRRTFSAKELEKATDNYHPSRIIHEERGFATFYKGVLPMPDDDKTVVAVKKYAKDSLPTWDVAVEAAVASQTNHINVVRFLGGCVEEEKEPALVFEYIPNGTLFEHIHKEEAAGSFEGSSSSPTALLSLELRLKIASETAGALAYLHSLTPPIIHLRLSTKHILLDYHNTAKLSAIGKSQADPHSSQYM
ncbi:cyclic nucleotide-gated ion channel 1-like, partial [Prunus avium]|uniref:Cyclic nucleotide-gated ion channel 1-like n=2 Tax=Prunus avium TaxID=42229 RepID=A0A6P5TVE6_PRUAV